MDGFTFYRSFYETIKRINKKQERAEAIIAICEYMFENKEPEILSETAAIAFEGFRHTLNKCKKNGGNAKKRMAKTSENSESNEDRNGIENESNQNRNEIETETSSSLSSSLSLSLSSSLSSIKEIKKKSSVDFLDYETTLEILREECPVIYGRHQGKIDGGSLGLAAVVSGMLDELNGKYSFDDFRGIFRKASKTFAVLPKYTSCDFLWLLNNLERIKSEKEDISGRDSTPAVDAEGFTPKQRAYREKLREIYGE